MIHLRWYNEEQTKVIIDNGRLTDYDPEHPLIKEYLDAGKTIKSMRKERGTHRPANENRYDNADPLIKAILSILATDMQISDEELRDRILDEME